MSKTKITAPVAGFTGTGVGGLEFNDGVAHTDDEALINYCLQAGYGVEGQQEAGEHPLEPSELAELRRQSTILAPNLDTSISDEDLLKMLEKEGVKPSEVRRVLAEPMDPTKLEQGGIVRFGTPLRDAAVDPQPGDYLPPTNAGQENPHGPLVVAPTIHGSEVKAVRPGEVHVDDPDKQQELELEQAQKTLVEGVPVGEALPSFPRAETQEDAQTGPLGLSDPGSVEQGIAAAKEIADRDAVSTYDPGKYGVDEVNSYLDEATEQEKARVLELEAGPDGKQRKGILVDGRHAPKD